MITRYWKGLVKEERSEEYIQHLRKETLDHVKTLDGFLGAEVLQSRLPQGVEFIVLTKWSSLEVIKAFAGDDITKAVVPDKAADMMIDFDDTVKHYSTSIKL